MKILNIVQKDLKISFRKRFNIILFVFSPLALVFIMGSSFMSSELVDIPLIICAQTENSLTNSVIEDLVASRYFSSTEVEMCEVVDSAVTSGQYRVGVVFPENFGQGGKTTIYLDNSDYRIAAVSHELLIKALQETAYNLTISSIQEMLGTIDEAEDISGEATYKLEKIRTTFEQISNTSDDNQASITEFTKYLDDIRSNLTDTSNQLDEMHQKLSSIDFNELEAKQQSSLNTLTTLYETYKDVDTTGQSQEVAIAINDLNAASQMISSFKQDTNQMKGTIRDNQAKIRQLDHEIDSIKHDLITSEAESTEKLQQITSDATTYQATSQEIQQEIDIMVNKLRQFQGANPEDIITPLGYETIRIFENIRFLDYFAADLLVTLLLVSGLLFSSFSIFYEKHSKTLIRTFTSPLSSTQFMLGKTITLLLLMTVQFILGILLLKYVFAVDFSGSFLLALLTVYIFSISFIAIGLIIAFFSDTERTAVTLLSTVILLLIFLSGSFVPFEGLPPLISTIAKYLPSSISITILRKITLYGLDASAIVNQLVILSLYSITLLVISYFIFSKKKESYIVSE